MKTLELLQFLKEMDEEHGKWLFGVGDFLTAFPLDSRRNILQSLSRYSDGHILTRVCRGVYANHTARSRKRAGFVLARFLRPANIVYLSREVRLQQLGQITQIYVGHLSLMTDGRDQTFITPYGILKYTHTDRSWSYLKDHLSYNPTTGLMEADEELAISDLRRSKNQIHINMYLEERERLTGTHAF